MMESSSAPTEADRYKPWLKHLFRFAKSKTARYHNELHLEHAKLGRGHLDGGAADGLGEARQGEALQLRLRCSDQMTR